LTSTEIASHSVPARGLRASLGNGLLREVALVAGAMLVYFGVRNLTAGAPDEAFGNAARIVDFERWLGIDWEDAVQASIVGSDFLVMLANWIYIWGHWPVILVSGAALFVLQRDRYRLLRNAMFVSGALGFAFFALFPAAPPRLLDLGLVDTVTQHSHAYRALQPPGLTNQYAAFPSLHVGWNVLVGIVLFGATNHLAVRVFAVLSPPAMMFAVVATANHFVLDVVAGVAVVLVGFAAAVAFDRARARATLYDSAMRPAYRGTPRPGTTRPVRRAARRRPARTAPRRRVGERRG
jgi:hypothetical protein